MATQQDQAGAGSDSHGVDEARSSVVKVRYTTRSSTWTIPELPDEKEAFFHDEWWDELHVVDQETKELLAMYTRDEVIRAASHPRRVKKRARSCGVVSVHQVAAYL